MHTTIKLHQHGWRSIYHNAPLARGLAARTATEYQAQRFRWIERRSGFRFATNLGATLAGRSCRVCDISITGALLSITGATVAAQAPVAGPVTLEINIQHETVTVEAEVRSRHADGPNRLIYGVQFCEGQIQAIARLALALVNAWVEEAQAAPEAGRASGFQEAGDLVWRPEPLQQPQFMLSNVEIATAD